MPYAANSQISQSPIEGGIEITDAQYVEALAGMQIGQVVSVAGGVFICAPPPEPEIAPEQPPTFDALKLQKLYVVNSAFESAAGALTVGYPESEKDSWPDQKAEAMAWNADNAAPTPYLDLLASYRGIDPLLYRQKTIAKVLAYTAAAAFLIGTRQKYADQITAATSQADLDAIVPDFTFPA